MPLRMGEMMVVVRAQDFASRTLRRVGGELAHMSREQMIAARRSDIAFNKMRAQRRLQVAQAEAIPLRISREKLMLDQQAVRISSQLASAQQRLNAAYAAQPRTSGAFAPMSSAQRAQITQARGEIAQLTRIQGLNARASANVNEVLTQLPARYQRAARSALEYGNAIGRSNLRLQTAINNLNQAQRAELAFNQAMRQMPIARLHEAGSILSGIGRTLQLFGAISTAGFGLAAAGAADFSKGATLAATQMTRISAGTYEAVRNAEVLSKELVTLSRDFPFSAREMSDAIYEIFSGTNVQRIDQGIALLDAFARVGVAGQVDIQTATKAGIIVMNNFRGAGDDVTDTLNRMFAIVRFGFMRFSDFALMLPKVAAAAAGSGQSLDDMAGAMAFLTRRTGNASIAATQISRAFDVMTRKEFQDGMEGLGIAITDVEGRLLPLPQLLDNIIKKQPELLRGGRSLERFIQIVTKIGAARFGRDTQGLVSTTEARRFFRFIFRGFGEYQHLQKTVVNDNAEFRRSYEAMLQSSGVQWDIFMNRVKAAVIVIGQAAIPVFADIGEWIAKVLDKWESLSNTVRGSVVKWAVIISIGTLIAGVFASLLGALITLGTSFAVGAFKVLSYAAALFGFSGNAAIAAGNAGRLLGILGMLAAIGTIVIGIKLEAQGDSRAWSIVGKGLQATGIAAVINKITRGKVPFVKAIPGAAVLSELLFPDTAAAETNFAGYIQKLDGLDKALEKTFGKKRAAGLERAAEQIFRLGVRRGNLQTGMNDVAKFLKSVGVSMDVLNKKTNNHADTWEGFQKRIANLIKKGDIEKAMELMQDAYGQTLDEMDQATNDFAEQQANYQRQMTEAARQAHTQAVDSLRSMYQQMEDVNRQAFGQLFQGPWLTSETFDIAKEWGITPRIQDMIKDLTMQTEQFKDRRQMIDTLFKRGLPQGFLNELQQMTPEEAMPILRELITATPKETQKLIALLNGREKLIKEATKVDFTSEIESFRKAGVSMADALRNGFQSAQIGKWFDNWVQKTFPDIIDAAVAKAIAEFKRTNPAPQKPAGATTRNPAGVGSTVTRNASNVSTDNSRTIHVTLQDNGRIRTPEDEADIRRKAFVVKNAFHAY